MILSLAMLCYGHIQAQERTQTLRGTVIDKDAKIPLIGANISLEDVSPTVGTTTDLDGYFKLENIPVGRHDIQISYLGYEPIFMNGVLLTSGKELVLNIEMIESTMKMDEVVVTAQHDKAATLNEFAAVSARSFSVEETSRYAASYFDPARMAQNYAGVSVGGSDDLFNEIIIRGNSPRGVLWRLEGIEIPNPNHFSAMGNSGGAVSMLSSSTLSNSDFYTGAFPGEYGNALSGVFDLNMRNGNNEKNEYAFMLGALGIEAAMEGPFKKGGRSSYLINYRYSTLAALDAVGLSPVGDIAPKYQDVSFKINLPTRNAGNFSLFGLGGQNSSVFEVEPDSTAWESSDDSEGFEERQKVGTIGLSHRVLLSDNSYLKTVIAASREEVTDEYYFLDVADNYTKRIEDQSVSGHNALRASTTYNHKFNAKHTLRAGAIYSDLSFDFTYDEDTDGEGLIRYFDNSGSTGFFQAFAQWKYRFNDAWTLNTGLHYSQMTLNNNFAIEPRMALQWRLSPTQTISAAAGLHSKMEHLATYLFDGIDPEDGQRRLPGTNLELTKAFHGVLGYDQRLGTQMRLKAEVYYQYLFDVPVESIPGSTNSIINAFDIWDVIGVEEASNQGNGRNIGIDLTLERFFENQYYFMVTTSLYESQYRTLTDTWYNTRFNGTYQFNALGGKEFKVGKRKDNIMGLNGKIIVSGGNRYTPINLPASIAKGETVRFTERPFETRSGTYYRFDLGWSYRINGRKIAHTIMLDIQNVTNRQNLFLEYYDDDTQQIEQFTQTGLFPVFNYRVEF